MRVIERSARLRPVLFLNFIIVTLSYGALFVEPRSSTEYRLALAAGGVFVALVGCLTFSASARASVLRWPAASGLRLLLAIAPWFALIGVIANRGLWWTQRPAALRFFVLYALANFSAALCLAARRQPLWAPGPHRATTILAVVLFALAIEGAAFGVTISGCGLSAALGAAAVAVLAAACFGSRLTALKAFAVAAAIGLAVVVMEVGVRALGIGQNIQEVNRREYARQFYTLTPPGTAFVNQPGALDEFPPALVSINTMGIRGPEIADRKTDLLLIGDSMIEARQLPWEQTIGARLQEVLRPRGLRVVAHGMRGWSPLLQWNWYLKVGRTLQPRTVILFFFWNDLWTAGDEADTFRASLTPDGRPSHFNVTVDADWIWYKHVRVARLAADVWQRLSVAELRRAFAAAGTATGERLDHPQAQALAQRLNAPPLSSAELQEISTKPLASLPPALAELSRNGMWPMYRPYALWTDVQRAAAARTEDKLRRFAEDVRADGARFAIVYVPNPMQVGRQECSIGRFFERVGTDVLLPNGSGIQSWLEDITARHGIDFFDPTPVMRERAQEQEQRNGPPLYLRADCHWTPLGHEFMAEYVATRVVK